MVFNRDELEELLPNIAEAFEIDEDTARANINANATMKFCGMTMKINEGTNPREVENIYPDKRVPIGDKTGYSRATGLTLSGLYKIPKEQAAKARKFMGALSTEIRAMTDRFIDEDFVLPSSIFAPKLSEEGCRMLEELEDMLIVSKDLTQEPLLNRVEDQGEAKGQVTNKQIAIAVNGLLKHQHNDFNLNFLAAAIIFKPSCIDEDGNFDDGGIHAKDAFAYKRIGSQLSTMLKTVKNNGSFHEKATDSSTRGLAFTCREADNFLPLIQEAIDGQYHGFVAFTTCDILQRYMLVLASLGERPVFGPLQNCNAEPRTYWVATALRPEPITKRQASWNIVNTYLTGVRQLKSSPRSYSTHALDRWALKALLDLKGFRAEEFFGTRATSKRTTQVLLTDGDDELVDFELNLEDEEEDEDMRTGEDYEPPTTKHSATKTSEGTQEGQHNDANGSGEGAQSSQDGAGNNEESEDGRQAKKIKTGPADGAD